MSGPSHERALRVLDAIEAYGLGWADARDGQREDEVDTADVLGRLIAQQSVLAVIVRDELVDRRAEGR